MGRRSREASRSLKLPQVPFYAQELQVAHLHLKATPAAPVGTVEAPDEKTAIEIAIDESEIEPSKRIMLIAQQRQG